MDPAKTPSEPVRLEVEVLVDAIDAIEENEDDVPEAAPSDSGSSVDTGIGNSESVS
jgi:hypothetical protein